MMKDFTGRIIYTGHKFTNVWAINCNDTTNYKDKEEVEEGTWFYDTTQSGCAVVWFVENKKVA